MIKVAAGALDSACRKPTPGPLVTKSPEGPGEEHGADSCTTDEEPEAQRGEAICLVGEVWMNTSLP